MTIDFDDMIEDVFPISEEPIKDDHITEPIIEAPIEEPVTVESTESFTEDPSDKDDDSTEDPVSKEYYEFLKEYGVLATPEDFEFDGTPEKLKEALDLTRESLKETTAQSL